ncbi:glycoside hydrolase family 2 protein [Aspergillus brunneoviolaceus CBS 621.78]|uniref:Glycoside hydrolase family 2 protein n=1 Tax=Aspergillus brunneoviolaceus CBS 621.78 TaxID=1450534 RepID=A0ACD1GAP3_9EURO|nr:glycoside hydrolase family 2 protein [Aspergillus brunneoviolaceus CBS 621.78]RAH46233.1 glycoside hydrolase family 2 protein [Aspergillus brunneoviolaceus CBS 621.78]
MPYPRPDFTRSTPTWHTLNGCWTFRFDDGDEGLTQHWAQTGLPPSPPTTTITVPYAFQTPASGVNAQDTHEILWYERLIRDIRTPAQLERGDRLLLRFGAVDYECSVWVGGVYVGGHRGGHVPFDLDISDAVTTEEKEPNRVTIRVRDSPTDLTQLRGKQYWGAVPEGIFYTPTSGIWLDVWVEAVPCLRIGGPSEGTVLRGDDIDGGRLQARVAVVGQRAGQGAEVEVETGLGGVRVGSVRAALGDSDRVSLDVDMRMKDLEVFEGKKGPWEVEGCWRGGVALWAPEHPVLYDVTIRLFNADGEVVDEVATTAGMRRIDWRTGDGTFRINGKPSFQVLVLDQGYWPDTGLTPPSQEALRADIELAMKMGFTGCRKHQKVEDPVFLYWADRLGFLVWGEIANAYEFSDEYVARFNREWTEAVQRDINHPSIVAWTPFNESWGYPSLKDNVQQRNHIRSVYYMTKTLDPTRPINDNCGWEHVLTDLTTYHDYADSTELAATCADLQGILGPKADHDMFVPAVDGDAGAKHTPGAPVICSEFGGVNITPAQGTTAGERDWGYTTASDPEDFLARLERLAMAVVKGGHTCGMVYTQLCDIEQEVNGLFSYDRKEKVPAARVKAIMDAAQRYYHEHVAPK